MKHLEKKYIMPTYSRFDILLTKGKGCYVSADTGKKYLDFLGGIATCSVGHSNPYVAKAIKNSVAGIINSTCLFYTEPQIKLAQKLSSYFKNGKCFFSKILNSFSAAGKTP